MMAEKLTYCIAKGAPVYLPTEGWQRTNAGKALCGRLLRVTTIKAGDIRNSMPVGIITVKGHQLATHPKNLKLVGRGMNGFRDGAPAAAAPAPTAPVATKTGTGRARRRRRR